MLVFGFLVFSQGIKWEHWPEMGEIPVRTNDSNHYFFEALFNALVKATRYTIWT